MLCTASNWSHCGPSSFTESFIHVSYNYIGVVSIICTVLVLFLVLTQSSPTIGNYKYLTALLLVTLILYDFQLCFSMCPLWVMQRMVCYSLGFADDFGFSATTQLILLVATILQMESAMFACISYRHQAILPHGDPLKIKHRHGWVVPAILYDLWMTAYMFSLRASFVDISEVAEKEPDLIWAYSKRSFCYRPARAEAVQVWAIIHLLFGVAAALGVVWFCFWHMTRAIRSTRSVVSTVTRRQQQKAIQALSLQCSVKVGTLSLALVAQTAGSFVGPIDYNYSSLAMLLFCPNSFATCTAILYSTGDYRRFLARRFFPNNKRSSLVSFSQHIQVIR